ncbi:MAG TPA: PAS domain S-box protein, partial [Bryobacteraceae bacterium]|nr:PAS domain S-box protein [Bryobacteraceae bacterium]
LMRDSAGKAAHQIALVEDFSDNKRDREALRASEERYRHLIETSSEGVWRLDSEMRIRFVSGQMTHLLGYAQEEMLGHPVYEFMEQEASDLAGDVESRLQVADEPCAFRFRRKDGRDLWAIVASNPIYDEEGRFAGSFGMITDITDRRRADEALRVSEERFRMAAESAGDLIVELDLLSGTTRILGRVGERIGSRVEDLPRDKGGWKQLLHPEDRERVRQCIRRHIEHSEPFREEFRIRINGEYQYWLARGDTVRDFAGKPQRFICVATNITDRKKAEEDLSRMNSALSQLSGHLLKLRDEEHRRLAHELHESAAQNLAGVSLNLSLLQSTRKEPTAGESASLSDALALLAQCAREISSLSYVLHPPLLEEAGLAAVLPTYVDEFSQRTGIAVSLALPQDLGRLGQDVETTLFRIVQEALDNVHRHAGSPSAAIRIGRTADEVTLEVEDEGRGLPKELIENGGVPLVDQGLGIMQMRERAHQFGGRMILRSGPRGTLLHVSLPVSSSSPPG